MQADRKEQENTGVDLLLSVEAAEANLIRWVADCREYSASGGQAIGSSGSFYQNFLNSLPDPGEIATYTSSELFTFSYCVLKSDELRSSKFDAIFRRPLTGKSPVAGR